MVGFSLDYSEVVLFLAWFVSFENGQGFILSVI